MTFADTQLGRYVDQMLPWPILHPRDPAFDVDLGSGVFTVEQGGANLRAAAGLAGMSESQQLERPWGDVLPVLVAADVTVLCLETVATTTDVHWPGKRFFTDDGAGPRGSTAYHKMSPPNLQTLNSAGVDYVALATNHAADFDVSGMMETQAALDDLGILHAGVGRNQAEAMKSATISRRGVDLRFYSFADYGNDFARDGIDVQAARANQGGINYLGTHGIRRMMPFSAWDADKSGVIEANDIATLQAASEAARDPDAVDWPEVFAFLDVGQDLRNGTAFTVSDHVPGAGRTLSHDLTETAGDGRVTLPEFESAMASVADGSRFDPGWILYLERVASRLNASRSHSDELLIVSVHWGGNWPPYMLPSGGPVADWHPPNMHDIGIQAAARILVRGGVDIIHGGSSHHLLGVEVYQGKVSSQAFIHHHNSVFQGCL